MPSRIFLGPAKYAVYGTFAGNTARITGSDTIAGCETAIETHRKQYPGATYAIWEATWTKLKDVSGG